MIGEGDQWFYTSTPSVDDGNAVIPMLKGDEVFDRDAGIEINDLAFDLCMRGAVGASTGLFYGDDGRPVEGRTAALAANVFCGAAAQAGPGITTGMGPAGAVVAPGINPLVDPTSGSTPNPLPPPNKRKRKSPDPEPLPEEWGCFINWSEKCSEFCNATELQLEKCVEDFKNKTIQTRDGEKSLKDVLGEDINNSFKPETLNQWIVSKNPAGDWRPGERYEGPYAIPGLANRSVASQYVGNSVTANIINNFYKNVNAGEGCWGIWNDACKGATSKLNYQETKDYLQVIAEDINKGWGITPRDDGPRSWDAGTDFTGSPNPVLSYSPIDPETGDRTGVESKTMYYYASDPSEPSDERWHDEAPELLTKSRKKKLKSRRTRPRSRVGRPRSRRGRQRSRVRRPRSRRRVPLGMRI